MSDKESGGTPERMDEGLERRLAEMAVMMETLMERTSRLEELSGELRVLKGQLNESVLTLSKRIGEYEEKLENLKTDMSYRSVASSSYRPAAVETTPTGRAFAEPRERWIPDHPYYK